MIEIPELAAGTIIEIPNPAKPNLDTFERTVLGIQLAQLSFQNTFDLSTLHPGKEPLYSVLQKFTNQRGLTDVRMAVDGEPIVDSLEATQAKGGKPFIPQVPQIGSWKEARRAEANGLGISFHLLGKIPAKSEMLCTQVWYIPRRHDIIASMSCGRAISQPERLPIDELPAAFQHAAPGTPESGPRTFNFLDWKQGILDATEGIKKNGSKKT
jgi:hypothetical protein